MSPTMSESEVLLLTRIRTLNKGNQALSAAWVEIMQKAFPGAVVRTLERRPPHLLQYTLGQIAASANPRAAFDALSTELAKLAPGPGFIGPATGTGKILLDETIRPPARFAKLRQSLNARGWAARAGLYADEYRRRLAAIQRARFVVVNPAGEFFPREAAPAFYHLLDAHVALKLGRPTAMVNHTMDIADPTLRLLIPWIYKDLALVGFRDEKSVGAFREMGGDLGNVLVTPDLALTTAIGAPASRRAGTIAVAINVPEATAYGYARQWIDVLTGLREQGFEVVLVSNELPADQAFYSDVSRRLGLPLEGQNLDHDRYAELLGGFDLVVSSRMHTAILAMVAGTPVVPVEGASFKITGLFQELGIDTPVVAPTRPGWTAQVVAQAVALRARREQAAGEVVARVDAIRERIFGMLLPRLRDAASAPAARAAG
jgi:polysaccharide pyruvyl transferase WcaK-like protein